MELVLIDFINKIFDVLSVFMMPAFLIAFIVTATRFFLLKKKKGYISFFFWSMYIVLIICETVIRRFGTMKETTDLLGFAELLQNPWFIVSAVENVIMFLPYGFFFCLAFWEWKKCLLKCVVFTLLLCAGIEGIQYIFVIGEAEVLDVLCNLTGAVTGYGAARLLSITRKGRPENEN